MKKAEEYIYGGLSHSYNLRDVIYNLTDEQICEVIEQAQKEAYNQAIEDVLENVVIHSVPSLDVSIGIVPKVHILKLKK